MSAPVGSCGYIVIMADGMPMPDTYGHPILFRTYDDAKSMADLYAGSAPQWLVRWRKPHKPRHEYGTTPKGESG